MRPLASAGLLVGLAGRTAPGARACPTLLAGRRQAGTTWGEAPGSGSEDGGVRRAFRGDFSCVGGSAVAVSRPCRPGLG